MTTEEKVALVKRVRSSHDLTPALAAVELPKATWYYHQKQKVSYEEKYQRLRAPLEAIARQHPEYGYRRTTVELREACGLKVNHKVVQRLHRCWGLPLLRRTRPPKPSGIRQVLVAAKGRVNLVAQQEEIHPFQIVYTDFTEVPFADGKGKAYLMPLLDHTCKLVYGWAIGERATTSLALAAWERAQETFGQFQLNPAEMIVHHDQDSVYVGYGWTGQLLLKDQVQLSYTQRGAKDNPEMEAFFSRFKNENRSLFLDAQGMRELSAVVEERMRYYNGERRHSSIGYMSPLAYIAHERANGHRQRAEETQ
jgi:putative transposase